jgi:hypothetical protein
MCRQWLKPLPERDKGAEAHYQAGEVGNFGEEDCRRQVCQAFVCLQSPAKNRTKMLQMLLMLQL